MGRYDISVGDEAQARATLAAMQARLARGPHDALGIAGNATAGEVRTAFLELTKTYHPARFGRMSQDTQRLSNEVFLKLREAHDALVKMLGPAPSPRSKVASQLPPMGPSGTGGHRVVQDPDAAKSSPRGRSSTQQPPMSAPAQNPATKSSPFSRAPSQGLPTSAVPAQPATTPNASKSSPFGHQRQSSQAIPKIADSSGIRPPTPPQTPPAANPASQSQWKPRTPTPPLGVRTPTPPPAGQSQSGQTGPIPRPTTPPGTAGPQRPTTPIGAQPRPATPPGQPGATRPPASDFDERAELMLVMDLVRRSQWPGARQALEKLASRVPGSKHYRAMLAYARAREAQMAGRIDDAILELQHALQIDPELTLAKTTLADLQSRRK